jgi:hypothetical protein
MVKYAGCKAYFNPTNSKDCGEMKKPEITDDYNKFMCDMKRADQMVHYYPCSRKPVNWTKKCVSFVTDGCSKQFHSVKKCTANQNQKGIGYTFKDFFILESSEKTRMIA